MSRMWNFRGSVKCLKQAAKVDFELLSATKCSIVKIISLPYSNAILELQKILKSIQLPFAKFVLSTQNI